MQNVTNSWLHDPIMTPSEVLVATHMPHGDIWKWCKIWFGGPAQPSGRQGAPNKYSPLDCLALTLGRQLLGLGMVGANVKAAVKTFRKLMNSGRYRKADLKISSEGVTIVEDGFVPIRTPEVQITIHLNDFVENEAGKSQYRAYRAGWEKRRSLSRGEARV